MAKRCFDEQWARDYSCAKYQDPAPQATPPVAAQPCPLNGDPEPQQPKPGCPLGKKKRKRHVAETDPAKARKVVKGWFDSIAVAQSRHAPNTSMRVLCAPAHIDARVCVHWHLQ